MVWFRAYSKVDEGLMNYQDPWKRLLYMMHQIEARPEVRYITAGVISG